MGKIAGLMGVQTVMTFKEALKRSGCTKTKNKHICERINSKCYVNTSKQTEIVTIHTNIHSSA